jgi:integrase
MTLGDLAEQYMRAYTGRDRTRTTHLARWRELLGAERPFCTISTDDVFAALERLRAEPALLYQGRDARGAPIFRGKPGRRCPGTVNRYFSALAALFTFAIRRRLAPKGFGHPCRGIERGPEAPGVVRFLTSEECERLLAACRDSQWPRLYLLVLMALTTGARRGELLALSWGDVDLERAIAHVRASKNGQPRALPLVPAVLAELRRFASLRPEARVFPARNRLDAPRHFSSAWHRALRAAGIRRFRFHDLRHTCASYLAQHGASLLEIADVMGHRQLQMVRRYAHLTTESKARLVERVLGGLK